MSDQPKPQRPLSEISHLFLSSVRDKQTAGAQRPVRKPPQSQPATEASDDLTPEEYAHVFGDATDVSPATSSLSPAGDAHVHAPHVTAVIASHLNGRQIERVTEYARHLCATKGRVGLIELDASEFRLTCFDAGVQEHGDTETVIENFDAREMSAAIEELNVDVDHWVLALPSPRAPEARALLREVEHWVLLSTCDHDGVVAAYRTLKGLAELRRPRLSLAILDAQDQDEVERVHRKFATVCRQFLGWTIEPEPAVMDSEGVAEHVVMCCRPTRDPGAPGPLANASQWQVTGNFLAKLKSVSAQNVDRPSGFQDAPRARLSPATSSRRVEITEDAAPAPQSAEAMRMATTSVERNVSDVIDLPSNDTSESGILSSVLTQSGGELVECPLRPPMCDTARLAVSRDRGIVLVAVAKQGLSDLRSIGMAYRWLIENRALIGMALPQFSLDAHQMPRVQLLVDHADASAETLQPLLQTGNVTIRTYRTLRWGEKLGLLLEAA